MLHAYVLLVSFDYEGSVSTGMASLYTEDARQLHRTVNDASEALV